MSEYSPASHSAPLTVETRLESLLRLGRATPAFLQGVFPFAGRGIYDVGPLDDSLTYVVPDGKTMQIQYVRAGNHSDDLLYLVLTADGRPIRYFPVGPKGDFHVALAIVETHPGGTRIEIAYAAPRGLTGAIVVDIGLVELDVELVAPETGAEERS